MASCHGNRLFVSVDMDDWYLVRWVTGSQRPLWPSLRECFRAVYGTDHPPGELAGPAERVLDLFDELNFRSTFFFTGQIARAHPELVIKVAGRGHEIACHNERHIDYEHEPRAVLLVDLKTAKRYLEDLSGQAVIGYRSPNSSVPASLVEDLIECGFRYDSSVTPTRRIMGKFGKFTRAPRRPYRPSPGDIAREGESPLWEFPWAVFPGLRLPAGSGIMHRIGGSWYNRLATSSSLLCGHTAYYFHPYELDGGTRLLHLRRTSWKTRAFCRRIGQHYERLLQAFLTHYRERLINGRGLLAMCAGNQVRVPTADRAA